MKFVIAGGGIAGLACALEVSSLGHEAVVLERRPNFEELGAGIQIAPNGFRALERLGVLDAVRARAVRIDLLTVRDGVDGSRLVSLDTGDDYVSRFGNPYSVVQRSDLYDPLLNKCIGHPLIELRSGDGVTGYANRDDGVDVHLDNGGAIRADVLIGADGLRSAVRAQLVDDGGPRVSGHTIFRTVVPIDVVAERWRARTVSLWAGENWHLVHYPISSGTKLNLAITLSNGATPGVSGQSVSSAEVLGAFDRVHPDVRELLELGDDWRTWVTCDRPPTSNWQEGRVILVGDAAHPMLQYAAQGACMALEDAVVLGETLRHHGADVEAALARFVHLRQPRTAAVQQLSVDMGTHVYHTEVHDRPERAHWLGRMSEAAVHGTVAWLHGSHSFTETHTGAEKLLQDH